MVVRAPIAEIASIRFRLLTLSELHLLGSSEIFEALQRLVAVEVQLLQELFVRRGCFDTRTLVDQLVVFSKNGFQLVFQGMALW